MGSKMGSEGWGGSPPHPPPSPPLPQHLLERSWYAVTETCLAFTVFRDDFSPRFVALFTLLLFLKCFHWLAEDRVDFVSAGWQEIRCKKAFLGKINPFSTSFTDGKEPQYLLALPLPYCL